MKTRVVTSDNAGIMAILVFGEYHVLRAMQHHFVLTGGNRVNIPCDVLTSPVEIPYGKIFPHFQGSSK